MPKTLPPVFGPHSYSRPVQPPTDGRQQIPMARRPQRKKRIFSWLSRLIFSPAAALALGLIGYYSLAGFTNILLPSGNLGGILIRAGTLFVVGVAVLRYGRAVPPKVKIALLPAALLFFGYSMRLIENFYFSDIFIPPGPEMIFLAFGFGVIFTSFALARIAPAIRDDQFVLVVSGLCVLFLVGMAFNLDALRETAEHRMRLNKINPIVMAHLAFAFLFYYLLVFSKSKRLTIEAVIFTPLLFFIFIYARSRGAILAGGASLAIYVLLLKGTKRIWMLTGLAVGGFAVLAFSDSDKLDIILKGLARLNSGDDQSASLHFIAWQGAWEQFLADFAFGRYAIELFTNFYPHNIFLESLMAVGFIGSLPFAIHIVLATLAAASIIRSRQFPIAVTFIAVLFFRDAIAAAGAGSLWGATGFWITSILVIVIWHGRHRGTRHHDLTMP